MDAALGDPARTHGVRLPQDLVDRLARHGLGIRDVDLFAVVVGPGSFTGLRVGMATMQGLAMTTGKSVVPVSSFEALLECWWIEQGGQPRAEGPAIAVAWMDGQRGDMFYSAWRRGSATWRGSEVIEPRVGHADDVIRDVRAVAGGMPLTFVDPGRPRGADLGRNAFPAAEWRTCERPLAEGAARIAAAHPEQAVAPHALRPSYVRRPDAELARARAGLAASPPRLTVTRLAPNDDLSDVASLQQRSFTNPWGAEAIQWELANTDVARLYVARDEHGRIAAYCACWLLFDELHINSLAVEESVRRRGVARRLLADVFREAVADGARSATLEVRRSNEAARKLYEGLGFVVEAVRRDYYQLPREDALILWHRRLAGPDRLW
jgi:ribosomal-protein-alanine N-acetyltransferase